MTEPGQDIVDPLTTYQRSAVRQERANEWSQRALRVLVAGLLAICLAFQGWNTVTGTIERGRINCEVSGWNKLWSAVSADQQAAAKHQPNPKFILPAKC